MESIDPATGRLNTRVEAWDEPRLDAALGDAADAAPGWAATDVHERCERLRAAARILRARRDEFAHLITREMGKLIGESRAEIEKCAHACDYYAGHAPRFLADEPVASDARSSYIAWQPLGTVLGVMPWNFPFWQVFRFAASTLAAGNTVVLKHASNVPQCALAIEDVWRGAGLPAGVFVTLLIESDRVARVIEDARVHALTLTGSAGAGSAVASTAGAALKKSVLELGGSDAFVVLEDVDLDHVVQAAVAARFVNAGQSCIAAKRFIVVDAVADDFLERFRGAVEALRPGDPADEATTLAPLARRDLCEDVHRQVEGSILRGAVAVTGCRPLPGGGHWYAASILDRVGPGMPAFDEELFGPVAALVRVADEAEAIRMANRSQYGLGGSVWTRDVARGEQVARRLRCGSAFVNAIVRSDPRLPFGGIGASGYGRELSCHGMREFVNAKTVWIG